MSEKILIIGGSGVLGNKLSTLFKNEKIVSTYKTNKVFSENSVFLDITKKNNLETTFEKINPDTIFHTAAITDLDWCEMHHKETFEVNTVGTKNIIDLAEKYKSKLIFISTDSVFDGTNGNYTENDSVNPVNIYSKSKVEAEQNVNEYQKSLIIRGTFFGKDTEKKETFLTYLLKNLKQGNSIKVPKNKISNGLFIEKFIEIIFKMHKKDLLGTYHIGTTDYADNFEFAKKISYALGYNEELIQECLFNDVFNEKNLVAKRPLNTTLNVTKIMKIIRMPDVSQMIDMFVKTIR